MKCLTAKYGESAVVNPDGKAERRKNFWFSPRPCKRQSKLNGLI